MTPTSEAGLSIITGTKAQFIKMVPILIELERRAMEYRVIDTGQHAGLVSKVINEHRLRPPDVSLVSTTRGVSTLIGGLAWTLRLLTLVARRRATLQRTIFASDRGLCLVHGDTMSTFLAALIARRAGIQVVHVEAGLRSHDLLNPFPEEVIRILVMRLANLLFAPGESAMANLRRMGLADRSIGLPDNTAVDALTLSLDANAPEMPALPSPFAIATIHRLETIYRGSRLRFAVDTILRAHDTVPMVWIEHPPTSARLQKSGLRKTLADAGVTLLSLQPHGVFLRLLQDAKFVITDGGTIQEEASYLGTPCLVLRRTTERPEGLGENVVLSKMSSESVGRFLADHEAFRRPPRPAPSPSPSVVVVDEIEGRMTAMAGR